MNPARDLLELIMLREAEDHATRATGWVVAVSHEEHPHIYTLYGPFADGASAFLYAIERQREMNSEPGESGWVCQAEPILPVTE